MDGVNFESRQWWWVVVVVAVEKLIIMHFGFLQFSYISLHGRIDGLIIQVYKEIYKNVKCVVFTRSIIIISFYIHKQKW